MDRQCFRPSATWNALQQRARLLKETRAFFDARGFLEVETPLLSRDTVIDRHLDPMTVTAPGNLSPLFLQTSPEFHMKRMLCAGAPAIYQVTRSFRGEECGSLHNPEFTIVEWYRPGDDMDAGMTLLSDLADALLARGESQRISYREAFEQYVGLDPHTTSLEALHEAAEHLDMHVPDSIDRDDRDTWLDLLLVEKVQPNLGVGRPHILYDYPASQAALAVTRNDDPPVAERFELYVDGIELANGYHELTAPDVLRARNAENNAWRVRDGKATLPEDSRLLDAMDAGMPSCAGVALGFDRLVMLAIGAKSIDEVIAFPHGRA